MAFTVTQLVSSQVRIPPGPHNAQQGGLGGPAGGYGTGAREAGFREPRVACVPFALEACGPASGHGLYKMLLKEFEMGSIWHTVRGYLFLSCELLHGKLTITHVAHVPEIKLILL